MLLKEIRLKNFRQYRGEQKIVFSTDDKKNVTLLLGVNTSGKTTFIQAFRWALYYDSNFTGRGKSIVLNHDVGKNMRVGDKEEVSVSLLLIHQNVEYEVVRTEIFDCKTPGEPHSSGNMFLRVFYYTPDGERRDVPVDSVVKISEILPAELSEYFFFDGEKIADSRKKSNVENSINAIMGLTPLKNMMSHINSTRGGQSVITDFALLRSPDDSGKLNALNNTLKRENDRLTRAEDEKKRSDSRLELLQGKYDDALFKFKQIEECARKADELEKMDNRIKANSDEIKMAEDDLMSSFAPCMMELYLKHLSEKIKNGLFEYNYEDKGIPDMTAVSINYLLDRGVCVCGSKLDENPECRRNMEELLSYLPPESIGSQITHLKKDLGFFTSSENNEVHFKNNKRIYDAAVEKSEELERAHQKLIQEMGSFTDSKKIREEYEQVKDQQQQELGVNSRYAAQILDAKKSITSVEREIERVSKESGRNNDIDTKIHYAQELYNRAEDTYITNSKEILGSMRATLSDVFSNMYHGVRTISLSDDYAVTLSVMGSNLDTSKGLDTVANFAFIASLLKVAKERAMENAGIKSEPYPLAMDAVFSNTDEKHIENICAQLPELTEQAILVIMDKDWEVAKNTLGPFVGRKYRINKVSESFSELKEESI